MVCIAAPIQNILVIIASVTTTVQHVWYKPHIFNRISLLKKLLWRKNHTVTSLTISIWFIPAISVRIRERLPGEITPVSAEQSRTYEDNEEYYAASHAIDLDLDTGSKTTSGSDGTPWLKVTLDNTNCIHKVEIYSYLTWTCSFTDCLTCRGSDCHLYSLTVSSERTLSDHLPTVSDCKYGDTVMIQQTFSGILSVYEVAVIAKQGGVKYWYETA